MSTRHRNLSAGIALAAVLTLAGCGDPEVDPPAATPDPTTTLPIVPTAPPTAPPDTQPPQELRYDPDVVRAELDDARTRWAALEWESYRFDYQYTCFCDPDATRANVQVLGGTIINDNGRGTFETVDGWFEILDREIGTAAGVDATYDAAGYPTSVYIDPDETTADEEYGLELIEIEAVPNPIAAFMTDHYRCGYGFTAATPGQATSFMVRVPAAVSDEATTEIITSTYTADEFTGEIELGVDLMANWCDDVLEEGEPIAEVSETWKIVAGTLDVTAEGFTATGVFTGLVARTSTGAEVSLGDLTITNDGWGFFAG